MSILTRWLLIPPVNARLIGRYRDYRRHGASAFSATLGCFWLILAWIFIPLEHPRWQRIRAEHKNLYPHINASRPRPLDPVRYLIQTCWLLIGTSRKETPKPRRRTFSGLQNIRGRYHQWMNELPERVSHKTQHLDEKKELGHLSAGARRLILGIIVTFSLILALICVTQPFNPLAQFIFLMLLWGVALIVRRMPGRFSALMLIVLSLTVSCRYIWWRYTSTLNWDDPVSLVCGLILLFAETYAWIVLVLGFQSPYNDQRSVIALLADSPRGYEMLNDAVNDSGKRATMFGSVAVIRESGINSLRVGDVYYVGHLPWFERLWYALANHPILLAVLAAISVVLLAWVLWRLLRIISRRRLNPDNE
ncbi:hypothetical protein UYN95_22010 [Escherichia coli]|nr:hypothetical protein [Escherichia coli]